MLTRCELELVVLLDMPSEARIDERHYTVENVILECCSDNFVMCKNLVIVPMYHFTSSRGVVYYVCSVELVESSRLHGIWIILNLR